jgi:hypothetical protein
VFPEKPVVLTTFATSPEGLSRHSPSRMPDGLMIPTGFRSDTVCGAADIWSGKGDVLDSFVGANMTEEFFMVIRV